MVISMLDRKKITIVSSAAVSDNRNSVSSTEWNVTSLISRSLGFSNQSNDAVQMKAPVSVVEAARIPEASTCHRELRLPHYKDIEELRRGLANAIEYGCIGFDRT